MLKKTASVKTEQLRELHHDFTGHASHCRQTDRARPPDVLKAVINISCTGRCENSCVYQPEHLRHWVLCNHLLLQRSGFIFNDNSECRVSILPRQTLTGRVVQVILKMVFTKPACQRLARFGALARKEACLFAWMFSWFAQGFLEGS